MDIHEWLAKNAEQVKCPLGGELPIWVTKARGDYLAIVGMEEQKNMSHLVNLTHVCSSWEAGSPVNIGFNPEENKWYGWSHRAICGFTIGDEIKRGDSAYHPTDKEDFLQDMIRFWSDSFTLNVTGEHRENGVYIEWEYSQTVPNEKIKGKTSGTLCHYPDSWGKGEWKAETMADARQMAIDFANNVG